MYILEFFIHSLMEIWAVSTLFYLILSIIFFYPHQNPFLKGGNQGSKGQGFPRELGGGGAGQSPELASSHHYHVMVRSEFLMNSDGGVA